MGVDSPPTTRTGSSWCPPSEKVYNLLPKTWGSKWISCFRHFLSNKTVEFESYEYSLSQSSAGSTNPQSLPGRSSEYSRESRPIPRGISRASPPRTRCRQRSPPETSYCLLAWSVVAGRDIDRFRRFCSINTVEFGCYERCSISQLWGPN